MRNESPVADLLKGAAQGRETAWQEIIQRYSSLVSSVSRRYGVRGADAEDVAANVWLHLLASMGSIRVPEALPGWLAATTRNECLALLRDQRRQIPSDQELATEPSPAPDVTILLEERRTAVRHAIAHLSERDKELIGLLFSDPPTPYTRISSTLNMPIGAIGPTRQRCISRVRRVPAITALLPDNQRPGPPPAA